MSGHSKWSKVKHQKAVTDSVKGNAFTKAARTITLAVRESGGVTDPIHNFHLRLAIEKAHDVNMPKENIERAIERGKGIDTSRLEQIQYEAYGPGGVALVVETATDNRQRTVSTIKNLLDRVGGTIASPGAVMYMFRRIGIITVPKGMQTLDEVMSDAIEGGAKDIKETDDMYEIYTDVVQLLRMKDFLKQKGITIDNVSIIMKPTTVIQIPDNQRKIIETLTEQLDSLDDVHAVYTNVE